ncbi:MAG: ParB/Srx family N-terminal domain-containing protein [Treponema sp.]|nr:ParB/Srx family N-terminal domain-containing protein [Treponema sp.]
MKKERKKVDINLLKTPERNTRIHPEKQIKEIRRSLKKWGQYRDAVVDEDYVILAGNGLVEAMRAEGFTTAWVVIVYGLSENDKKKFMLADNKTAGLGVDNLNNIEYLIQELAGDFDIPGFDDEILSSINAASEEISQALDDYGKASVENLRDIEAHAGVNLAEPEPFPPDEDIAAPDDREEQRKIICPECGAEIWL